MQVDHRFWGDTSCIIFITDAVISSRTGAELGKIITPCAIFDVVTSSKPWLLTADHELYNEAAVKRPPSPLAIFSRSLDKSIGIESTDLMFIDDRSTFFLLQGT